MIMKGEFTQKGKEAMERFKMESASEVGGGQMVKKMIDAYKMQ